jgi:hypothetical protein
MPVQEASSEETQATVAARVRRQTLTARHGRTNDIVARASVWECQPEG